MIAGRHIGTTNGHEHLITLDIGGTSADIAVIPGRLLEMNARESQMGGYPILSPKLDVTRDRRRRRLDRLEATRAAPSTSARAAPARSPARPRTAAAGPIRRSPTPTSSSAASTRRSSSTGACRSMPPRPATAVERIGAEFGMGVEQAALAILTIVNANMVQEVRVHSVRRGYDPRECALVAFGGAGPLHGCDIAEQLEIPAILLPPAPGITSAMGLLATDLKYDNVRTVGLMLADAELRRRRGTRFDEMEAELRPRFDGHEGSAPHGAPRGGVPLRRPGLRARRRLRHARRGLARAQIGESFRSQHFHEYGFDFAGDPIEIINLRVVATAEIPTRPHHPRPGGRARRGARGDGCARTSSSPTAPAGTRRTRSRPTTAACLLAGNRIAGPAVVHEMDSTSSSPPAGRARCSGTATIRLTTTEAAR